MGTGHSQENVSDALHNLRAIAIKLLSLCDKFASKHKDALGCFKKAKLSVPQDFSSLPKLIDELRIFNATTGVFGKFKDDKALRALEERQHKHLADIIRRLLEAHKVSTTVAHVIAASMNLKTVDAPEKFLKELGVKPASFSSALRELLGKLRKLMLIEQQVYSQYDRLVSRFIRIMVMDPILKANNHSYSEDISSNQTSTDLASDLQKRSDSAKILIDAFSGEQVVSADARRQALDSVSAVYEAASVLRNQATNTHVLNVQEARKKEAISKYHAALKGLKALLLQVIANKSYKFDKLANSLSKAELISGHPTPVVQSPASPITIKTRDTTSTPSSRRSTASEKGHLTEHARITQSSPHGGTAGHSTPAQQSEQRSPRAPISQQQRSADSLRPHSGPSVMPSSAPREIEISSQKSPLQHTHAVQNTTENRSQSPNRVESQTNLARQEHMDRPTDQHRQAAPHHPVIPSSSPQSSSSSTDFRIQRTHVEDKEGSNELAKNETRRHGQSNRKRKDDRADRSETWPTQEDTDASDSSDTREESGGSELLQDSEDDGDADDLEFEGPEMVDVDDAHATGVIGGNKIVQSREDRKGEQTTPQTSLSEQGKQEIGDDDNAKSDIYCWGLCF